MSAFICNPEHFGVLAAYAVKNGCAILEWASGSWHEVAQAVARGLARENIRSVAHRYPNDVSGKRPGPGLKDEEIEEAAALYAAHFLVNPPGLAPIQIINLCGCVDYQSCETDDWKSTLAWKQLDRIKDEAITCISGYGEADWEFSAEVPEIDALYYRKKGN